MNMLIKTSCLLVSLQSLNAVEFNISTAVPIAYLEQDQSFKEFNDLIHRLNLTPKYHFRPRARGLSELERGVVDGDYARSSHALAQFKNIIVVKIPIANSKVVAFYRKGTVDKINSVSDLKNYKIGYLKGWYGYLDIAKYGKTYAAVSQSERLINMLVADRFDILLFEQGLGEFVVQSLNLPLEQFESSDVLSELPLHFLLNKKHKKLSEKLEGVMAPP